MEYQVDLDVFHGPLDLLLYLVKREEIDLRDIPIARVAEQFKQYLDVLQVVDVERVGDFLVMAATLAELKSKLLLPRPEESGEQEEDPRQELSRLFRPPYTRSRLVGYFLAILELTRRFTILAEQDEIFGDIWVWLAPPAALPG